MVGSFRRGAHKGVAKARQREGDAKKKGGSPRMGHGMDTDQKCARGGDGAQRAQVSGVAGVGERVEQETHKKEVPGGVRMGPGRGGR